jgi:hypothetical protein
MCAVPDLLAIVQQAGQIGQRAVDLGSWHVAARLHSQSEWRHMPAMPLNAPTSGGVLLRR